jgi:4-hydroxy-tetrahydrodipicolinate synthase
MDATRPKPLIFKGAATALITPFKNGEIDYVSLASIIDFNINENIDALVVAGTTGEAPTLSFDEQCRLISFTLEHTDGRVPVIAGCGSNCTEKAKNLARFASREGCDGLLVITPYYNKATPGGMLRHFEAVSGASTKPIILYNVPSRTGCALNVELCKQLSKMDNVVGIKEASGSLSLVQQIAAECGDALPIYSGNDDATLPILAVGGVGTISVLSNIFPKVAHDICALFFEGRTEEAKRLHLEYLEFMNALFCEINPIPVKTVAASMGLCREEFRLPLCPIEEENRVRLMRIFRKYRK